MPSASSLIFTRLGAGTHGAVEMRQRLHLLPFTPDAIRGHGAFPGPSFRIAAVGVDEHLHSQTGRGRTNDPFYRARRIGLRRHRRAVGTRGRPPSIEETSTATRGRRWLEHTIPSKGLEDRPNIGGACSNQGRQLG